jgi:hypothetical protein
MDAPTLSLIAPLHNEAPNLPRLLEACAAALERTGESWEILLIDDGSDDGSWAVHSRTRCGRTAACAGCATRSGWARRRRMRRASAPRAGSTCSPSTPTCRKTPPRIPAMLERLRTDADMVVGWRKAAARPAPESAGVVGVQRRSCAGAWRLPLHDANCGFKGMRREVADALLPYLERDFHRYLALIVHRLGFRVAEVVVAHSPRAYGRSRYGLERYGRAFVDLWAVWRRLRRR